MSTAHTTRSPTGCGLTTCTARAEKSRPPAALRHPTPAACEACMEASATRRDFLASGVAAAVPFAAQAANRTASTEPRPGLLTGKRAVIYGAAGAIGSAVSRAFAREGAQLFLAGRTLEHVRTLA